MFSRGDVLKRKKEAAIGFSKNYSSRSAHLLILKSERYWYGVLDSNFQTGNSDRLSVERDYEFSHNVSLE